MDHWDGDITCLKAGAAGPQRLVEGGIMNLWGKKDILLLKNYSYSFRNRLNYGLKHLIPNMNTRIFCSEISPQALVKQENMLCRALGGSSLKGPTMEI